MRISDWSSDVCSSDLARGGTLVTGSDRISDAIAAGRARLLIHEADAAEDGRRKLDGRLFAARGETGIELPAGRAELSLALGRENVVHAAIVEKAAADRVENGRASCRERGCQ